MMLEYIECEKCGTEFVKGRKIIPLCRECAYERRKEQMREYMRNKFNTDDKYKEEQRRKSREYQRSIREAHKEERKKPTCHDCGKEVRRTGDRCHECSLKHKRERQVEYRLKQKMQDAEFKKAKKEAALKKREEKIKKSEEERKIMEEMKKYRAIEAEIKRQKREEAREKKKAELLQKKQERRWNAAPRKALVKAERKARKTVSAAERSVKPMTEKDMSEDARLALLKKVHAKYHEKKEMQKERVMRMRMEQERIAEGWW